MTDLKVEQAFLLAVLSATDVKSTFLLSSTTDERLLNEKHHCSPITLILNHLSIFTMT